VRILRDFIFVKVDKKYRDEIITKSGVKLYVDTTYRPEWHVTMKGEVVAIPEKLTDQYFEMKGIVPEVEVGDIAYFNYLVVDTVNEVKVGDQVFYKVDYPSIFAYMRNGELNMVGSWVFVRPYIEQKEEKVGSLYLPEMLKSEERKDMGIIYKIGKPLTHEHDLGLKSGDKILFKRIAAFEIDVEGEKYYCMKQSRIMAKVLQSNYN